MFRHARLPAALLIALACLPAHAAQRAFVSSTGNDANAPSGCTPALPCRSFQAAHGAVDAGGEIVALDTAGFGTVTITKSVSILGNPGTIPSISVASGVGVTINTAGVRVTLRNLNINGVGGTQGINMEEGAALTVENCVVSNFTNAGLWIYTTASQPKVRIANTILRGNSTGAYLGGIANVDIVGSHFTGNTGVGLYAEHGSGGVLSVAVTDSVASGNGGAGFFNWGYNGTARMSLIRVTASNNAAEGIWNRAEGVGIATLAVGSSMASNNGTGFFNENLGGNATFESLGNNTVRQNGAASSGTITAVAGT